MLRALAVPRCRLVAVTRAVQPRTPLRPARPYATSIAGDAPTVNEKTADNLVTLRPYQKECVETCLHAFREGRRQIGVSLATGSGKTVIFTELIGRVPPQAKNATRTLILAHRRELVEQAARHCQTRYPDKRVEIDMGNLHASGTADVTVASVMTLASKNRLEKYKPDLYKLILVDEAHHIVAPTYLTILEHFGLMQEKVSPTAPALLGVSATMARFDGLAIGKAIKHIVYHKDYIDMIGESWLSDVIFTTVRSKAKLGQVTKAASGDFAIGSLSNAVNTPVTNEVTVRAWLTKAKERKSTLVFCVDVRHIQDLTDTFRKHGVDAQYVTGGTPVKVREQILDQFRKRQFPVLLNCGVFTEGTDVPNIDCVLLARPTRSRNLLVQMIGRGMRLYPGKKDCHIIDMVSTLQSGIVTSPTLFGLDPDLLVERASPKKMAEEQKRSNEAKTLHEAVEPGAQIEGTVTFKDYDSVTDLISDTSGERHIRALSPNAWVNVGPDRFVLVNTTAKSYMLIERRELWQAFIMDTTTPADERWRGQQKSGKRWIRATKIAENETLEGVVRGADTFVSTAYLPYHVMARANWRKTPASESQVEYLNKNRLAEGQEALTVNDITKGAAMDMITKLIHGAKGRYAQSNAQKRREQRVERAEAAWEQKQRSEQVTVGPLPAG